MYKNCVSQDKKEIAFRCLCLMGVLFAGTVGAADITDADTNGAYVWNALDGSGNLTDGDWSQAANWLLNGATAAVYPNADAASVRFKGSKCTVSLSENVAVSNFYVGCSTGANLTLNLAGRTLSVGQRLCVGNVWYASNPHLTVTNGTMNVAGQMRVQYFPADEGANRQVFRICGPEARMNVGSVAWPCTSSDSGAFTTFEVLGGASFASAGVFYIRGSDTVEKHKSVYRFDGEGTKVVLGGLRTVQKLDVIVSNGAELSVTGLALNVSHQALNRCLMLGYNCSRASRLIVDNATLNLTNYVVNIGDSEGETAVDHNEIIVTNGSTVRCSQALNIGYRWTDDDKGHTDYNSLSVYDGGVVKVAELLSVGTRNAARNNRLRVKDGTVEAKSITSGIYYTGRATNNWIEVSGTHPKIRTTEKLWICCGGGIEFHLPKSGYEGTPIEVGSTYDISKVENGNFYIEASKNLKSQLVIYDEGFAVTHPKTTITLVACKTACATALRELAEHLTVHVRNDLLKGVASVSEDGKRLLYTTPALPGTVITIR